MRANKVIHVETRRVSSHDQNHEAIYETITQKLQYIGLPNDPFNSFVSHLNCNKYTGAKVVKVLDFDVEKQKYNETELIEEFQAKIDSVKFKKQELGGSIKDQLEQERKEKQELEERLKALEAAVLKQKPDIDEEFEEMKLEAKDLGISLRGIKTKEQLQAKLDEAKS